MTNPTPNLDIFRNRARLYLSQGRYDDAFAILDDLIAAAPEYGPAYADRGTTRGLIRQYDEALLDLKKAITLGAAEPALYNTIGTIQLQMGQAKPAIESYGKAIEDDPAYPLTYFNRATAYEKVGDKAAALTDLQTCLRFESDDTFKTTVTKRIAAFA